MLFKERIEKLNTLHKIQSQCTSNLTAKGRINIPYDNIFEEFCFVPKLIINTIDKILYNFIRRKKHNVKRITLITSP